MQAAPPETPPVAPTPAAMPLTAVQLHTQDLPYQPRARLESVITGVINSRGFEEIDRTKQEYRSC